MTHHITSFNYNKFYEFDKSRICAGRNCRNVSTYFLKIVLVKKSGWFCDSCKQDLEDNGLVDYSVASKN